MASAIGPRDASSTHDRAAAKPGGRFGEVVRAGLSSEVAVAARSLPSQPSTRLADAQLRRKLLVTLAAVPLVGMEEIVVRVAGGIVLLAGEVHSETTRLAVVQAARHVPGIVELIDALVLKQPLSGGPIQPDVWRRDPTPQCLDSARALAGKETSFFVGARASAPPRGDDASPRGAIGSEPAHSPDAPQAEAPAWWLELRAGLECGQSGGMTGRA